jgi:hypothetical protein
MKGDMRGALRQVLFPREFRIPALSPSKDLETAVERPADRASLVAEDGRQGKEGSREEEHFRLFAEVCTGLWRLRQKMVQPGTDRPLEGMRRAFRHLASTWDLLNQAGFRIQDHTGEPLPEGGSYALQTLAFQPTPDLARETVVETIKPTIYYGDRRIQMGVVIVGMPEGSSRGGARAGEQGDSDAKDHR